MTVTFRVRELRQAKQWSQEYLAKRANVRRATVSRIENERIKVIALDVLERLANALGVEAGALVQHRRRKRGR